MKILLFLIAFPLFAQVDSMGVDFTEASDLDLFGTIIYGDTSWNWTKTPTTPRDTLLAGTEQLRWIPPYTGNWVIGATSIDTSGNESDISNTDTVTIWETAVAEYLADAQAYFDTVELRGGTITSGHKTTYNTFIGMLIDSISTITTNLSEQFDRLRWYGAEDSIGALTSIVNPSSVKAILIGGMVFTANDGVLGASGDYVNWLYNPTDDGVVFTQNSASMGFYSDDDVTGAYYMMGADVGSTNPAYYFAIDNGGSDYYAINGSSPAAPATQGNTSGLFVASRHDATHIELYRNGVSLNSSTQTSVGVGNLDFHTSGLNDAGTHFGYAPVTYKLDFAGKDLSDADNIKFYNCIAWLIANW